METEILWYPFTVNQCRKSDILACLGNDEMIQFTALNFSLSQLAVIVHAIQLEISGWGIWG